MEQTFAIFYYDIQNILNTLIHCVHVILQFLKLYLFNREECPNIPLLIIYNVILYKCIYPVHEKLRSNDLGSV